MQVHFTFVLFLLWLVGSGVAQGKALDVVVANGLFMLGLFGCVMLHELGHALMAKHYGIQTKDITLLPIGGVARLERMPTDPWQELWVALAGPAVNVVIAAGLILWLMATRGAVELGGETVLTGSLAHRLLIANISLVVFNMLPAFPMDGGRVVRALLATRMEYTKATQIAASLGQGMALLFGVVGFMYNPMLVFIAFFVWIGAGQEASMVLLQSAISGIPVRAAMITVFDTVVPGDSLETVVNLVLRGSQQDFPVVEGEQVVGVVTRDGLMRALSERSTATAGEIMDREMATADASDMLEGAFQRLQASPCHTAPVLQQGQLVGILTAENVGEFLMIQSARQGKRVMQVPQ
jgi:Zn-dependent protease/CBS domain-containing protein